VSGQHPKTSSDIDMRRLKNLYRLCRKSDSSFLIVTLKHLSYLFIGKNIIAHQNAIIKGAGNITTKGSLKVGVDYVGFTHNRDVTYLNVNGRLDILGHCSIGRGCRFDIGKNGMVAMGDGTFINPFTNIIIMHKLEIGKNCSISWNCQFLDEDFHQIKYEEKQKPIINAISIGN
jgi:acetyltransferase-like isoleucine patch superfamily enzyme